MAGVRWTVLGWAAFCLACGGGARGPQDPGWIDIPGDSAEVKETIAENPPAPIEVTEDFRAVYAYEGRPGLAVAGRTEFRIADPRDTDPTNDQVLFSASPDSTPSCEGGCWLDRSRRWLAAATTGQEAAVQVYELSQDGSATAVGEPIPDVVHAQWTDGLLYLSQGTPCPAGVLPTTRCFDILKFDPQHPASLKQMTRMPPVEGSSPTAVYQYNGYFSIGEDLDRTLLFFVPTHVSLSVWVYRSGVVRQVLGPLCAAKDPYGNCIPPSGGSAMYREDTPAALSADGRTLVFALVEENRELRFYRLDLGAGSAEPAFSTVLTVPDNYLLNACYNRAPWQFTEVRGPIRFTRDQTEVLFIGAATCDENTVKPWTNILRLSVAKIGAGKPLQEGDYRKVTDNPQGYTAQAIAISGYDLSPSGEYVVFTGTPTLDEDGNPLPTVPSGRHERDSEVHVARLDGQGFPRQLTNNVEWRAQSVFAIPAP